MSATSSCDAIGCSILSLSDETIDAEVTEESCRIDVGPNYQVSGPSGDLTLRAGREIRVGNGFEVGLDGTATFELDPLLLP